MGRGATIAKGNVWYEARIEAAKGDERLSSRAGAYERTGVSEEVLKNLERGLHKHIPVDLAVTLADEYNAPQLLNHYCLHECPIGCRQAISDEVLSIERVTVKLLKGLKVDQLAAIKEKLVDIAEDGVISEDEKPELKEIVDYLDGIAKTVSELKTLGEIALSGGSNRV